MSHSIRVFPATVLSTDQRWLVLKGFIQFSPEMDSLSKILLAKGTTKEQVFDAHVLAIREAVFEGRDTLCVLEDGARPTRMFREGANGLLDELRTVDHGLVILGGAHLPERDTQLQGTRWYRLPTKPTIPHHAIVMSLEFMNTFLSLLETGGLPTDIQEALGVCADAGNYAVYRPRTSLYVQTNPISPV